MNNQIFIENKEIDLNTDDLDIFLTKKITDFTDLSARFGSFSYTIKIPKTEKNSEAFKYIDYIDTANKYVRNNNYECQILANGNLLIDGIFNLQRISQNNFEGQITGKFKSDIITRLGNKTLQDLNLLEIDYEGMMIPYGTSGTYGITAFQTPTADWLNPLLGFDFYSLTNGKKDGTHGLYGTTIDYTDYYTTPLIAYSNFFTTKSINQLNTLTNNFSYNDFKPSIRLVKVLEQIFKDIGYNLEIQNDLINDPNILIPYTGELAPTWNWNHLSKTSVYTDKDQVQDIARFTSNNPGDWHINQFTVRPFISSDQTANRNIRLNTSRYNIFTDARNLGSFAINDLETYNFTAANSDDTLYKLHYIPTNGLKYDFNNNFSFLDPSARNSANNGWLYSVEADGEYTFDLDIKHSIKTFNYLRFGQYTLKNDNDPTVNIDDLDSRYTYFPNLYMYDREKQLSGNALGYDGKIEANKTWTYNSQEKWHMHNMVIFVKVNEFDEDSFLSNLASQFNFPVSSPVTVQNNNVKGNIQFLKTGKKISNYKDDSIIAHYFPMQRDLYTGNHNKIWEDYINLENSILIHNPVIPQDYSNENDLLNYQGFNPDTQILHFENNITYDPANIPTPNNGNGNPISPIGNEKPYNDKYSKVEQLKRKLVRLKRRNQYVQEKDFQYWDDYLPLTSDVAHLLPLISQADASGNVKFKFKSILKKGDQIRMYYVTIQQFKQAYKSKPMLVKVGSSPGFVMGANFQDPDFPGNVSPNHGITITPMNYSDAYTDEININSYSISCTDTKYSSKLQLANFLPSIKQSDFITDFLQSNNLFYDIVGTSVVLKSRKDFFSNQIQIDLTSRISVDDQLDYPVPLNKKYIYGVQPSNDDDFKDFISVRNPTTNIDLGNNIYFNQDTKDLSSKILFAGYDRNLLYRKYNITWSTNGAFRLGNTYTSYPITAPAFMEGGENKIPLADSNPNYSKASRLVYSKGVYDIDNSTSGTTGEYISKILVNGLPYERIKLKYANSIDGFLLNGNRITLYVDKFTDLSTLEYLEVFADIDSNLFYQLDLSKKIIIQNTTYYIQEIQEFNTLEVYLTKLVLLKL